MGRFFRFNNAKLRKMRERLGMSVEHVAVHTGVAVSTIVDAESGAREPGIGELARIASVYGIPHTRLDLFSAPRPSVMP
jgi:transcriptional regulator with XRE-family HTH domain